MSIMHSQASIMLNVRLMATGWSRLVQGAEQCMPLEREAFVVGEFMNMPFAAFIGIAQGSMPP